MMTIKSGANIAATAALFALAAIAPTAPAFAKGDAAAKVH